MSMDKVLRVLIVLLYVILITAFFHFLFPAANKLIVHFILVFGSAVILFREWEV